MRQECRYGNKSYLYPNGNITRLVCLNVFIAIASVVQTSTAICIF